MKVIDYDYEFGGTKVKVLSMPHGSPLAEGLAKSFFKTNQNLSDEVRKCLTPAQFGRVYVDCDTEEYQLKVAKEFWRTQRSTLRIREVRDDFRLDPKRASAFFEAVSEKQCVVYNLKSPLLVDELLLALRADYVHSAYGLAKDRHKAMYQVFHTRATPRAVEQMLRFGNTTYPPMPK